MKQLKNKLFEFSVIFEKRLEVIDNTRKFFEE